MVRIDGSASCHVTHFPIPLSRPISALIHWPLKSILFSKYFLPYPSVPCWGSSDGIFTTRCMHIQADRQTDIQTDTDTLVPVWLSGNTLASINELTLRRARLVLGWVTVSGVQLPVQENLSQYITSHPGQLSLVIPPWVGAVSTSQRAVMLCGWGVKASMVRVWVAGKLLTVWCRC